MKKLVLILLLVGIAGFGGMTVWGSLRAKQEYRNLILAIAESPDARILETSYERGWLQSKSRANVEIRGPLGETFQRWLVALGREGVRSRVGVRMQQTIEHGYAPFTDWLSDGMEGTPIVARMETHLELDEETQSEISAVLGRLPSVSIFTVIRASGVGESSVIVPAQRLESKLAGDEGGGWNAQWKGLRGNLVYTTDFDHLAASFHSPGIEGSRSGSLFDLGDLRWSADLSRDESGLLVGGVKAGFGSFRLTSGQEGDPGLELDDWTIRQSNRVEAGSFESALAIRVQAIRLGDRAFGPGRVEAELRNLDARSLARLQSRGAGALAPTGPQDVRQPPAGGGSTGLLSDLFSRSPQLEIQTFYLATPSGDLKATLRIDLDGSRPEFFGELFALLLAVEVHGAVELPADILDEMYRDREEELLTLRREGWVLLDGERYRSRLDFEGGQLSVNGLPKALGELPGQSEEPGELPQVSAAPPPGPEGVAPGLGPEGVAPGLGPEGVAPGPELLP